MPIQLVGHFFGVGSLGEPDATIPMEYISKLQLPYVYQLTSLRDEDMIRQFAAVIDEFEEDGDFILDVDINTYREITSEDDPILPAEKNIRAIYTLMDGTEYPFFKTQQTAPSTMCFSIRNSDGQQLVNRSMFHFFTRLMARIAQGQLNHIMENCRTIIFCQDDPGLGFVKNMIESGKVTDITLEQIIEKTDSIYPGNVIPAFHFCDDWRSLKKDDWYPLWESKPKLAHIDVVRYPPEVDSEQAEKINQFLQNGGGFALGVLPNVDDGFSESVLDTLRANLTRTFRAFAESGVNLKLVKRNSMVSTQCGLSGASPKLTRDIHELSPEFHTIFNEQIELF
ncbi:hypothetical protein EU528_10935 [Candidatus Thorarchaeota archaeon]|nr:MAG: hypothetical protein EU528_10935 [Candidatus Thorarchaeota archaeon]